jgi:hypothetical protein
MGAHRVPVIEGIVRKIEDRVAEWRLQDAALKEEAEANRDELWAEAAERERLLAAAMHQEEIHGVPPEGDSAKGDSATHQVVFVVASDAFADALQDFSPGRDRLLSVVPAREGGGGMGLRGSWLVLEKG